MGNSCLNNFESLTNEIKFKPYLIMARNPAKLCLNEAEPFYELKNGVSQQLNPFINVEETINDFERLKEISQIRYIKWFKIIQLFVFSCKSCILKLSFAFSDCYIFS